MAFDNISSIRPWLSDALCRAATGDAWVDRALYTDSDLVVLRYLRVLILTSIDSGAMRGDLGDRLLPVDLDRIPPESRRPKRELDELYEAARPRIFGALLDVLVQTMAVRPGLQTERLPRMADFSRMLAATDSVLGTNALSLYAAQASRVAQDVVEGDPVAVACIEFARREGSWTGTAAALLERISPDPRPRDWPSNARGLAGRLRRAAPALRELGIELDPPHPNARPRCWSVRSVTGGDESHSTVGTVEPSGIGSDKVMDALTGAPVARQIRRTDRRAQADGSTVRRLDRPTVGAEIGLRQVEKAHSGRSDGSDGEPRQPGSLVDREIATTPSLEQVESRARLGEEEETA